MPPTTRRASASASDAGGAANDHVSPEPGEACEEAMSVRFLMILSPAKTLDVKKHMNAKESLIPWTMPSCDVAKTKKLAQAIQNRARDANTTNFLGLASASLRQTALQYWRDYDLEPSMTNLATSWKPCGYTFSGSAFQGLDMASLTTIRELEYLQRNLRICDPLHGWLRPMDVLQPYRFDMEHSKDIVSEVTDGKTNKLVEYWRPAIAKRLRSERFCILNLASDEYAPFVIDAKKKNNTTMVDGVRTIKVIFQQDGRVLSVHAKRARGLMARYMAQHQVTTVEQIRQFDLEGYRVHDERSTETTIVFNRRKNWKDGGITKRASVLGTSKDEEKTPATAAKRPRRNR